MKKLRYLFLHNFWYKVTSLLLAACFWWIVQGEEILEINRRLMVQLKVPEGYVVQGSPSRVKDVTIRGPRVLLGDYSEKPLEAQVVLSPERTGEFRVLLSKEYLTNWDDRIKLTIHDPYIEIYMDEEVSRTVPVREYLKGVPAEGYIIEKTTLRPATVTVTGLKGEVRKIKEVMTEPIDISGIQQSKSYEAALDQKSMNGIALNTDRISASFQVGEKKVNSRFSSIPIEIVGSEYVASVRPRYVTITIQGTPGILSFVKRKDFKAFVEVRELAPGQYEKEIKVKIPPETILIETYPENASVDIVNQKK